MAKTVEELHLRLSEYDAGVLERVRNQNFRISKNAAATMCIRAVAAKLDNGNWPTWIEALADTK